MIPFIAELVVFLSRRFHQKASSPLREVLMNLGVLMMVVPLRVLLAGASQKPRRGPLNFAGRFPVRFPSSVGPKFLAYII